MAWQPENAGFDVRDDVKVFDFGLAKSLDPKLESEGDPGMYKLTGRTGSFPYMAPEIARCRPYNCSADVFSFGIMLWEILALQSAFGGILSRRECYNRVSIGGERPCVRKDWPPLTREVMKDAWAENPRDRPPFNRVAGLIRADLTDVAFDDDIVNRTAHMEGRSRRSFRAMRGSRMVPVTAQHELDESGGV